MDNDERDTLLMALVESALGREAKERQAFLETVQLEYPELFADVKTRVEWQHRMGGFLREPIVARRRETAEHPFQPGELVAGRFRILRELGRGGMGVVYEASDEKLKRRIAIKCAQREFQTRLTPEARAALEVSHPNVCKLHELHTAETAGGPVDFLTMEFVEGETLAQRVEREGALSAGEVREIALQICAGLVQAHKQGVIHGDIKGGNVILSRSPEGAMRAVLTDFGLARLVGERLRSPDGTASPFASAQGGTLAYMAPELLDGGRASVASDVYALGILFHLMLTGKLAARCSRRAPEGAVKMDLPPPWNRIVSRCVETQPENRFASVEEVTASLTGRRAAVRWVLAAALGVIAVLAAFLWNARADTGPAVRLVVLPAKVEGPRIPSANGVGADVAERLSGARRNFNVIGPQEALRNHVDSAEKAKSVLGATHVLRTELRDQGSQIAARAVIVDTGSGESLRELKGEYASADTASLAKALIATVTGAFQLRSGVPREPTSGTAYQDYVEGVALMRRDNESADEAMPHFERASQLDPRSALPYTGLAEAQMQKFSRGAGAEWLELATDNLAKAKSINPESVAVLLISGYVEQEHGRYEQAIAQYTRATQLEPQSGDAWRRLAGVYEKSDRIQEATATYRKAIEAQPDYYSNYLSCGTFYLRRSQFQQAEEAYRKVTGIAPGLPAGHLNLGLALMEQGKFPEAERELLAALHLTKTALILVNIGALYYAEERYQEAVQYFEDSIALGSPTAVHFRDLGDGYRHLKRRKDAERAYREGIRMAQEDLARNPRAGQARATLALLAAFLGNHREAEFEIAQALATEPNNTMVRRNAAITYEVLGEREKTLSVLRDAPPFLLQELNRQPDVKDLSHDPRFQAMMPKTASH